MIIELLDHTADPEATIARAAAVCYDSDTSPDALQRRVKHLMRMRHLSTLRFAYATFRKYIARAGKKGPAIDDYKKALDYLERLIYLEEAEFVND